MRSPIASLQPQREQHQVSWESLLMMGSHTIDLEPTFSRVKVQALKKIVERLPEKSFIPPNTPRTQENNIARRRQLAKFGECNDQEIGVVEKIVNKMPRVKIEWEPKFAKTLPQTPRNRRSIRDLSVKLVGGIPHANPTKPRPASPRTPRKQIRCRHCSGSHWSHRCPNKIRRRESLQAQKMPEPAPAPVPVALPASSSVLSKDPPTEPGPKTRKYKFDFKVRREGFQRRGKSKWMPSPRYTAD